jgi:hypothetical protein
VQRLLDFDVVLSVEVDRLVTLTIPGLSALEVECLLDANNVADRNGMLVYGPLEFGYAKVGDTSREVLGEHV